MLIRNRTINYFVDKLRGKEPFAQVGYSDAEWYCMVGARTNRPTGLGQIITKKQGEILLDIMKRRQEIQALRKLKDREILCADDMYITPQLVRNPMFRYPLTLFNMFLKGYWVLLKIFI